MRASVQARLGVAFWAAACWPLWEGYGRRLLSAPDQAWLFLAPLTAVALVVRKDQAPLPEPGLTRWLVPVLFMIGYAAAFSWLPTTLRAAMAMAALLFIPGSWRRGPMPDPAIAGLCLIGLPAVAMLQFYFGYPLRAVAAVLAVPVLQGAGFDVVREGALLNWSGRPVAVDAACSGLRMGWTALYLALAGAGLAGLGWGRSVVVVAGAAGLAVMVNALRVVVLFGIEAAGLGGRPFLHAGIGVAMFIALAVGVVGLLRLLKARPG
jgi:exosortase/archaeosortase family protein